MSTLSAFLPHITPEVEGAPTALVLERTRRVVRDFCERAHVVRVDHAAIDLVADQAIYTLTEPADLQIIALRSVLHDDRWVEGTSEDVLDTQFPRLMPRYREHTGTLETQWRLQTATHAELYFQPSRTKVRLVPAPDAAMTGGLAVEMICKPTPTTTAVPDVVYEEWYEAIACGVLAQLLRMPNRPWHDPRRAADEAADFERAITKALGTEIRSRGRSDRSTGRTRVHE